MAPPLPQVELPRINGCRILSELSSGGMAILYQGIQETLNRPVAVKVLRRDAVGPAAGPAAIGNAKAALGYCHRQPDWADRFIREARLLATLQHENLPQVYDLIDARGQGGTLYIIMELCTGTDLLELLLRQGVLPAALAAYIALGAAQALAYIHARGIWHRDVKPANLLLTRQGTIKLVDFGTAWNAENARDRLGTEVGLGTPSYMSPEQALGQPLDHRSDQFSLGIVLYQMLTGRKPFLDTPNLPDASPNRLLAQVVRAAPPPLRTLNPAVPRRLAAVVERCLRRRADERFPRTEALVQELSRSVEPAHIAAAELCRLLAAHELIETRNLGPWRAQPRNLAPSWLRHLLRALRQ